VGIFYITLDKLQREESALVLQRWGKRGSNVLVESNISFWECACVWSPTHNVENSWSCRSREHMRVGPACRICLSTPMLRAKAHVDTTISLKTFVFKTRHLSQNVVHVRCIAGLRNQIISAKTILGLLQICKRQFGWKCWSLSKKTKVKSSKLFWIYSLVTLLSYLIFQIHSSIHSPLIFLYPNTTYIKRPFVLTVARYLNCNIVATRAIKFQMPWWEYYFR